MGRRKERRAAASMASGRRVKLDLFAEPSSSSSADPKNNNNQEEEEEVGEGVVDDEEDEREGEEKRVVPNSQSSTSSSSVRWVSLQQHPSASFSRGIVARRGHGFCLCGKRHDNPLLLLGQYSDEEANEEQITGASARTTSADQMAQVEEFVSRECGTPEDNMAEDVVQNGKEEKLDKESPQLNAAKELEGSGVEVPLDDPHKGEDSTAPGSDPWTSGVQIAGEVAFGWKLVMHEETNQYYYWNVETGETSWEVPAIFAQATDLGSIQHVNPVEESEGILSNTDASCTLHGEPVVHSSVDSGDQCNGAYMISNDEEQYKQMDQVKIKNEGCTEKCAVYLEPRSGIHQTEITNTGIGTIPGSGGMDEQPLLANEHHESGFALSMRLVSYAESLIERLKNLERSDFQHQCGGWISKYIMEIEIRLSDFNSLLAYGPSLLPFWMHSEEKLKGLERTINDHTSLLYGSGQTNEVDSGNISLDREDNTSYGSIGGDSKLDTEVQVGVPNLQNRSPSPNIDASVIQAEADDKSTLSAVDSKLDAPSVSPSRHIGSDIKGNIQEVNVTVLTKGLDLPSVTPLGDEDMDVDMEVDDENTTNDRGSGDALVASSLCPTEHFITPDPPVGCQSSELEIECDVPPPPDEDWIPPPPTDAEPLPPPPPDDPPAPTYTSQPPYSETVPHHSYAEQYNMLYPVPSEYYGSMMTEVPTSNYYAHSVEPQAVGSQSAEYFDNVLATYPDATVIVNPMDPSVYYDLSSGTVPPVSAISTFKSSGLYGESDSATYLDRTADQTGTQTNLPESECSSLLNLKGESDAFAVRQESEMLMPQIQPLSTTVQATTTAAPMPLTAAASCTFVQSTSVVKAPTKVSRNKKRTIAVAPTLRSNKKVSSLVDKWKAAKEELHEDDEDEPLNAYEMLERKRQREIEAWRAHQIATGEAKDNANFQPLGGDWRERVKRRRAKSSGESVRSRPDAPLDEKQPPDLTELSRGLPSGWQAYWDESSKKTYYGNTLTSETTWIRPTQ